MIPFDAIRGVCGSMYYYIIYVYIAVVVDAVDTVEIPSAALSQGDFGFHSRCGCPVDSGRSFHRSRQRFSIRSMSSSTFFLKAMSAFIDAAIFSQPCITVV